MFRQLQPLALIVRSDALPVDLLRGFRQRLIDEPADHLTVFENERHFMGTDLEHGTRTLTAAGTMTEARIEETCVMHAKLADQGVERHHFGRMIGRHAHGLARGQYVELARIEDETAALEDRLPIIEHVERTLAVDIDKAGVTLGAITDRFARGTALKIDRKSKTIGDIGPGGGTERFMCMQPRYGVVGARHRALAKADLGEPGARAHERREGPRTY